MPKISIIVPIYKVEDYLDRCVKSLVNQTYTNIEIVLVNDGSPDNCPIMCDNYAKEDSRIKVIHKENGGLSDARNYGIKAAQSEYVLFVDSDDYLEPFTCEEFVKILDKGQVDIIAANAKMIENNKVSYMRRYINNDEVSVTGPEFLKQQLTHGIMYMAAWLNLYKTTFLIDNNLQFKVGLLHEDEEFTPRAFLKANNVKVMNMDFYNYIIRSGSITKTDNLAKNGVHIVQTCYELHELYDKLEDQELKALLKDNLVTKYMIGFQIGGLYRSNYKHILKKEFILVNASSKKNKLKARIFFIDIRLYYYLNKAIKFFSSFKRKD